MSLLKPSKGNPNASSSTLGYSAYGDGSSPGPYPPTSSKPGLNAMVPPMPTRTPSPTPSDIEELKKGALDWKHLLNWRNWFQRKYLWYWVAAIVFGVIAGLLSIYHKQLIDWLTPGAIYLRNLNGGWAIPIGIMFVLSFPPLFGNEIVHVLCGVVWGLWIGFGIVCAGTFLGEVGNFYAFRYCCQSRGDKLERTSVPYACLAKCVRDGGFLVALVARLSAIPGHFTTAVFSTCGMSIWTFCLGAFLSLPKQFATVYIGVVLDQAAGAESTQQRIISGVVLTLSIGITIFAAWWILKQMERAKPAVLAERRKKKAMEIYGQNMYSMSAVGASDLESRNHSQNPFQTPGGSTSTITPYAHSKANFNQPFNHDGSNVNLPLSVKPQRWDANGRAIVDNQERFDNPYPPTHTYTSQDQPFVPPGASTRIPPPNIMVTRASGLSMASQAREGSYDDVALATPTGHPPAHQTSPPHAPRPIRRQTDEESSSNESAGPAWRAGTTREDEEEARSPLTAAMRQNASAQREPRLYNPYDEPAARSAGHAQEPTEASYHTAHGGHNGFEMVDYSPSGSGFSTPQQITPPEGRRI